MAGTGWARRAWGRTGWARLGRIADALERIEARPAEPPPANGADEAPGIGIRQRMGLTLLLDPASSVDRRMIETGSWEPEQIAKLTALAAEAMSKATGPRVFLDIGAYFGLYALLMDKKRLFDRIIAFEPDRMNFAQLQAQLLLNDAAYRIEARNEAVGEKSATSQMQRSDLHETGNRGGAGVWPGSGADPRCVPSRVVAIDDLDLSGGVVVGKIDVEGYQEHVLRGMRETIARNACILQVEALPIDRVPTEIAVAAVGATVITEIGNDLYCTNRR